MALEVALEDDLYFADLNRQICLLIDDDDNDNNDHYPVAHFHSISHQEYLGSMIHHPPIMPSQYLYQQNCRREIMSKGTGVFIPQSSQPRRKSRQPKRSSQSYTAKSNNNNKQLNSNRRVANTVAHSTLSPPPCYATNYVNRY
ncbi:uncharacterized protein LOC110716031 [Chenopodium quinoa]|uniref:uncharacterized protein LOC110716031 n=1 Tax=Chenopodium quinoa TaxID=63459 RepID=UPI000B77B3D9|nr:uncharacterized protein LOC110716031 [Chenopodium quinoa]